MWKLIALVLAVMIWVKNVGGVTLKNSLVLLLRDPHHLDGNPWSCSSAWWVELDVVLGTHLNKALGASSNASISSWRLSLPLFLWSCGGRSSWACVPLKEVGSYFSCRGTNFILGYWSSSHSTPLSLNFRSKPTPWFFRCLPCLHTISSNCLLPTRLL